MSYSKVKTDEIHDPESGHPIWSKSREWNTQRKPWIHPLPFNLVLLYFVDFKGYYLDGGTTVPRGISNVYSWAPLEYLGDSDLGRAVNKARESFLNSMHDVAQNANNVKEINQNVSAVTSKVKALATAVSAIKKGNVTGAAKALGVKLSGTQKQKIIKRLKQPADAWLELHFGWVPLVQDIGNSIENIQGTGKAPTGSTSIRVTGRGGSGGSNYQDTTAAYWWPSHNESLWICGCRCAAKVKVENPNSALANQMGFVNPLSVAWEAVPFSFVVDWFTNVGQCLSAMTDFVGYSVEESYTTTFRRTTTRWQSYTTADAGPLSGSYSDIKTCQVHVTREQGIAGPTLRIKPFKGFSIERGATAVSLLVQQLSRLQS